MKKHLLFAAMLAMGAAAAVATTQVAPYYAAADEETSTPATEEEYNALQKAVDEAVAKMDSLSTAVAEKYPDSEVLGSLAETKTALQAIGEEAKSKYSEGTLTSAEVVEYQATVKSYSEGMDDAMAAAELEEYQVQVNQHYMAAYSAVSAAMEMPESVANYYYDSVDLLQVDMFSVYSQASSASTAEEFQAIFDGFDAIAEKADSLAETISAAAELVDSINATLDSLNKQVDKVKADFPDYDLSYTEEAASYWQAFVDEFKSAPAEGKSPYNLEDIEQYATNFEWFKEEADNLYTTAQQDEYMSELYEKYMPADTKIGEMIEKLETDCPNVKDEYYTKLDDLRSELSNLYFSLYWSTVTREEFDKMLARVDEIVAEAEKLYAEAEAKEKEIATGINAVSADAVSADKVFTMDGKAVESAKGLKGAYIVNGKKVILK